MVDHDAADGTFQYDVAFSFHLKDEGVATQINDKLQDRFNTFIYMKKQDALVGRDGAVAFNSVFNSEARIVVILYRSEWGETPYTRVEMDAIRNRAHYKGWDFTIWIPTEEEPSMPPWVPITRIYFSLRRFGIDGACGAIEKRIGDYGGILNVETTSERSARLKRGMDLQILRDQFRESEKGSLAAKDAYRGLCESIEREVTKIGKLGGKLANLRVRNVDHHPFLISGIRPCMLMTWNNLYANTLSDAYLSIEFYDGMPQNSGSMSLSGRPVRKIIQRKFRFELFRKDVTGYRETGSSSREFSCEDLASDVALQLMDIIDRYQSHPEPNF